MIFINKIINNLFSPRLDIVIIVVHVGHIGFVLPSSVASVTDMICSATHLSSLFSVDQHS